MENIYQDEQGMSPEEFDFAAKTYNWVFHFNVYTGNWAAIPRELSNDYFNDINTPGILFSRELDTLVDLIHRTSGDDGAIEQLLKNQ